MVYRNKNPKRFVLNYAAQLHQLQFRTRNSSFVSRFCHARMLREGTDGTSMARKLLSVRGGSEDNWCGWRGSNPRPLASEANTLSTELQPRWGISEEMRRIQFFQRAVHGKCHAKGNFRSKTRALGL
jgi:hypothetical protein